MFTSTFILRITLCVSVAVLVGCGGNPAAALPGGGVSPAHVISNAGCSLGRITVFNGPAGGSGGVNIASGLDGDLWYGDIGLNDIVRMTTHGLTKTLTIPSGDATPEGIALGPNSRMWFTTGSRGLGAHKVGGATVLYSTGVDSEDPSGITVGPDKELWFVTSGGPDIPA